MQVFDAGTRVYRTDLKVARQRLAAIPDGAPVEAFYAANRAIDRARAMLEWYQRLDIEAGIYDHQGDEF